MARTPKSNRSLQRQDKTDVSAQDVIPGEVVLPTTANAPLINAEIVQILIQNNHPDQVNALMKADLDYNQRRLEIIREHAAQHPDAIEGRKTRQARRHQYMALLALGSVLLLVMPFVPIAIGAIFGTVVTLIICGILVNARERELDLQGFIKLINIVIGRETK